MDPFGVSCAFSPNFCYAMYPPEFAVSPANMSMGLFGQPPDPANVPWAFMPPNYFLFNNFQQPNSIFQPGPNESSQALQFQPTQFFYNYYSDQWGLSLHPQSGGNEHQYHSWPVPYNENGFPHEEERNPEFRPINSSIPSRIFEPTQVFPGDIDVESIGSEKPEKSCQTESPVSFCQGGFTASMRKRTSKSRRRARSVKDESASETSGSSMRTYCKFCKSNGEPFDVYSQHALKNSCDQVICPILSKYTCPMCGKTGTEAHTVKYCPLSAEQAQANHTYKKVRNSVGKLNILKY